MHSDIAWLPRLLLSRKTFFLTERILWQIHRNVKGLRVWNLNNRDGGIFRLSCSLFTFYSQNWAQNLAWRSFVKDSDPGWRREGRSFNTCRNSQQSLANTRRRDAPSLEVQGQAVSNLVEWEMSLPTAQGWNWMMLMFPSNPNHAMTLRKLHLVAVIWLWVKPYHWGKPTVREDFPRSAEICSDHHEAQGLPTCEQHHFHSSHSRGKQELLQKSKNMAWHIQ